MKKLNKKSIILITTSAIILVGLITTSIILVSNINKDKTFNATVVDITEKKKSVAGNIISWDSNTKTHEKASSNPDAKCAIIINDNTYEYEDFNEGWLATCSTYKNIGAVEFILYTDWIATNGSFGNDNELKYYGETGSIVIKNWTSDITLNLNGYKIDRNLSGDTLTSGEVLYLNDSHNITIKNGCITGGGNKDDGGGIWAGGEDICCTLDNMVITGNVSGCNGGGIYTNDAVECLELNNTTVTGNYAEGYGGGVYCDYSTSFFGNNVLNLKNVVKIQGNNGNDDRDNLTLYACKTEDNASTLDVELTSGSCIYVTFSRYDDVNRTLDGNFLYDHNNDQYFHTENDNWELLTITNLWGGTQHEMLCLRKKVSC